MAGSITLPLEVVKAEPRRAYDSLRIHGTAVPDRIPPSAISLETLCVAQPRTDPEGPRAGTIREDPWDSVRAVVIIARSFDALNISC